MREYQFRGKIKESNTGHYELDWAFGNLVRALYNGKTYICDLSHFNSETRLSEVLIEVVPETVGQYTEKEDKNGSEIFEGDICKIGDLIYIVNFKYSYWNLEIISKMVYCYPAFNSHCGVHCEVIGNIHDNPELLEVNQ